MTLERQMDVVANNVANVNTSGFKADKSLFEEYLRSGAHEDNFRGSDRRVSYVQDRGTFKDFSQGPTEQTKNPLDVAGPFENRTSALLSCAYAGALFLRDGRLTPDGFADLNDRRLLDLARRVTVHVEPTFEGYSTRLEVRFSDGSSKVAQHLETDPPHSLLTIDDVDTNLRQAYRDAGMDETRVSRIRAGLQLAFETGNVVPLCRAMARDID